VRVDDQSSCLVHCHVDEVPEQVLDQFLLHLLVIAECREDVGDVSLVHLLFSNPVKHFGFDGL
jgi:hypothetical protein